MLKLLVALFAVSPPVAKAPPADKALVNQIAASGRCADLGETPDERVAPAMKIAPGQPPVLSFRLYEGKQHLRFGNAELLLDDAGH